ncbi:MAG: DUF438 domain-containing protein [Thermoplasmata archaeon]|nr:MAG: DUF438 domain-containing protein [Thermoplasmata archaeon]
MSELLGKKERLKRALKELHKGRNVEEIKKEIKDLLSSISPMEIPLIEQELMQEGVSVEEIAKLCDLHVELFREAVERKEERLPEGHPLHTLYKENEEITKDAEKLALYAKSMDIEKIKMLAKQLRLVGFTHYDREETLIFPYLERRGITAMPTTLWRKHDEIRIKLRQLLQFIEKGLHERAKEKAKEVASLLKDMVFRENKILYPALKTLLTEGEWMAIKQQEVDFGFYKVKPKEWKSNAKPLHPYEIKVDITQEQLQKLPEEIKIMMKEAKPDTSKIEREGDIKMDTGYMLPEEINALFKTLPFGITFIDKDDRVRFFSGHRIFKRTPSVLGRPVQLCHPPKSVHIVEKILKAFKDGSRNKADFWIKMGDRFIYILYIPVRDDNGEYLGTLEIEQDITELRKLEGEKKILDWK